MRVFIFIMIFSSMAFAKQQELDLSQMLKDAKMVPHVENGEVVGLKAVEIKPGSEWEKVGLQKGDVIKTINGEGTLSPEEAMELYSELKEDEAFLNGSMEY